MKKHLSRNKKGAIELSMTTIIVIIIGVTLLGLGLVWVKNVFNTVNDFTDTAFTNAQDEIEERMGSDQIFYVSGTEFEVKAGKKQIVNIGIRNTIGADERFQLIVEDADNEANPGWFKVPKADIVKAGDKKGFPTSLSVPKNARAGDTFLYRISAVTGSGDEYGSETVVVNII